MHGPAGDGKAAIDILKEPRTSPGRGYPAENNDG